MLTQTALSCLLAGAVFSLFPFLAPRTLTIVVFGVLSVLCVVTALSLLWLMPLGRILALALAGVATIVIPVGTVIGVALIVYLRKPVVEALFAGDSRPWTLAQADELRAISARWSALTVTLAVTNVIGLLFGFLIASLYIPAP